MQSSENTETALDLIPDSRVCSISFTSSQLNNCLLSSCSELSGGGLREENELAKPLVPKASQPVEEESYILK